MGKALLQFPKRFRQAGMTLLELIIACAILMILASAAMPVARYTVQRKKEAELHSDLREMRDAIDRYKDAADRNLIRVEVGTEGYPPDLDTLVKGVDMVSQPNGTGIAGATNPGQPIAPSTGAGGTSSGFGASGFGSTGSGFGGSGFSGSSGLGNAFGQTNSSGSSSQGQDLVRHVRFLRRIPVDPMTGKAEWGMRSVQDDPDASSWGGKNVFDVFSK
ncbi:MAG TPA: prepilin-type N-terminal cleavage/methylation domain-containing protein, partial [Bryobacteraceae bacterium]